MNRFSLRTLLLVPLLLTLGIGALLLGVFIHRSVEADQLATIDDELNRSLQASVNQPGGPPRGVGARDTELAEEIDAENPFQVLLSPSGEVLQTRGGEALIERDLTELLTSTEPVTLEGEPLLRARGVELSDGNIAVVALSIEELEDSLASLRRSLVLGGLVLVAAQALIALAVISAVKRPISVLRDRAHQVAGGALDTPLDVQGAPSEVASLTDDLSAMVGQLRSTISEREQAAETAERARADMQQFMADASHELRTPLTAISGYHDLHTAGMLDAEGTDRAMQRIGAESARLTDLVNDLLRLLRPTDPKAIEAVDVGAVASAVVHDLRAAHRDHKLSIRLTDAATDIQADPSRIHQAVLNLAANACQHTPAGTSVDVVVERTDDAVVVEIVDDGPGFESAKAEELLQPFVRLDASRSRHEHDGAGLGLTITHRIAEQHGGSLSLSSTPGEGTRQTLQLPATPA